MNRKPAPGPGGPPPGGPGNRGPRGPRPKVKDPGKLFMRLIRYIFKNYAIQCITVVICIFITVLASVQGTLFMQTLIDDYIIPLTKQTNPDFSNLAHTILRVASFYALGAVAAYANTRIMVNVTQGTLRNLRDDMFTHMQELPIRYFDTHSHGDIMSTYTNDTDTLRQMISQSIPQFLNSIISIVSIFISMLTLNIPLTLVTLAMVGVTLIASKKIGVPAQNISLHSSVIWLW
jgi:ATP-binding cassette subfamily B multidrug efflux pump